MKTDRGMKKMAKMNSFEKKLPKKSVEKLFAMVYQEPKLMKKSRKLIKIKTLENGKNESKRNLS